MRIIPTADNVTLERREYSKKNGNVIHLVGAAADDRKGWFVVDIGPQVTRCKKGDQIAFNSSTGAGKITLADGGEFVVMSEKDIVGVIVA